MPPEAIQAVPGAQGRTRRDVAAAEGFAARIQKSAGDHTAKPAGIRALREAALEAITRDGLPHAKTEAWKYTALTPLFEAGLAPAPAADADAKTTEANVQAADLAAALAIEAPRLVFVNGTFRPELSDLDAAGTIADIAPLGPDTAPLAWAAEHLGQIATLERMPLAAANAACWQSGLALRAASGQNRDGRLHLVFVSAPGQPTAMVSPRLLVTVEDDASLDLVESHIALPGAGAGPLLANGVTEVAIGTNGRLRLAKLVNEAATAHHVWTTEARLAADAQLETFTLTLAGALVRNETRVRFTGDNAEAQLGGIYVQDGAGHVDTTTFMDHAVPHARSTQLFKGIVGGTARAVFQGKVLVREDAQKTDARQTHKAMLLSAGAEVDAKPELEIYADDVKCGHGAAIGKIDDDMLFYLQARGIDETRARALLIQAFLAEALEEFSDADVQATLQAALVGRLAALKTEDQQP